METSDWVTLITLLVAVVAVIASMYGVGRQIKAQTRERFNKDLLSAALDARREMKFLSSRKIDPNSNDNNSISPREMLDRTWFVCQILEDIALQASVIVEDREVSEVLREFAEAASDAYSNITQAQDPTGGIHAVNKIKFVTYVAVLFSQLHLGTYYKIKSNEFERDFKDIKESFDGYVDTAEMDELLKLAGMPTSNTEYWRQLTPSSVD